MSPDAVTTAVATPAAASATFSGTIKAEVAAFAAAGGTSSSGTLTLSTIPAGATIVNATLYANNYFNAPPAPAGTFAGTALGAPDGSSSNGQFSSTKWDVTSRVTGSASYSALVSGFNQSYGLALVVVFSHSSLPAATVMINDAAADLHPQGAAVTSNETYNAAAGRGELWIHTAADNYLDSGGVAQTGETIKFNGTSIGGPIDANLGNYGSLFHLNVTAQGGANTLSITTPKDWFGWDVSVLMVKGADLDGKDAAAGADYLDENAENAPGVFIQDSMAANAGMLKAFKTDVAGYTRRISWGSDPADIAKIVVTDTGTGTPFVSGDVLTEADDDKEYTVVADPTFAPTDSVTVSMEVLDDTDTVVGEDRVLLRHVEVKVMNPIDTNGDGLVNDSSGNEFVFNTAAPGVLTIPVRIQVTPDEAAIRNLYQDRLTISVGAIGSSVLTWDNPVTGQPTTGRAVYDAASQLWLATATFTGLPMNNTDFGRKTANITAALNRGGEIYSQPSTPYEVFYDATATNHPGGVATDPNWFYYYRQNEGGADYDYTAMGRSRSTSGTPGSIHIGNEAYAGDKYITTVVVGGQLQATGFSAINRYYANFVGVVAHERLHANNGSGIGDVDADVDFLPDAFEMATSQTDPNDPYSARGVLVGPEWDDGEVYAGGPVEERGVTGANTTQDWASPGTNKA